MQSALLCVLCLSACRLAPASVNVEGRERFLQPSDLSQPIAGFGAKEEETQSPAAPAAPLSTEKCTTDECIEAQCAARKDRLQELRVSRAQEVVTVSDAKLQAERERLQRKENGHAQAESAVKAQESEVTSAKADVPPAEAHQAEMKAHVATRTDDIATIKAAIEQIKKCAAELRRSESNLAAERLNEPVDSTNQPKPPGHSDAWYKEQEEKIEEECRAKKEHLEKLRALQAEVDKWRDCASGLDQAYADLAAAEQKLKNAVVNHNGAKRDTTQQTAEVSQEEAELSGDRSVAKTAASVVPPQEARVVAAEKELAAAKADLERAQGGGGHAAPAAAKGGATRGSVATVLLPLAMGALLLRMVHS